MKKCFGGDTAHVKAGTADFVLLDETHSHAELASAQRGGVTSRSCSKNDKVKSVLSHV
jgi:hypothetical protein